MSGQQGGRVRAAACRTFISGPRERQRKRQRQRERGEAKERETASGESGGRDAASNSAVGGDQYAPRTVIVATRQTL